jgi:hypothetical protein
MRPDCYMSVRHFESRTDDQHVRDSSEVARKPCDIPRAVGTRAAKTLGTMGRAICGAHSNSHWMFLVFWPGGPLGYWPGGYLGFTFLRGRRIRGYAY